MFKRCTQCGAEYQRTVERCVDCGARSSTRWIRIRGARASRRVAAAGRRAGLLRVADPWRLEELAEALQRAGIGSRIDSDPPGGRIANPEDTGEYGRSGADARVAIYVRESDLDAARRVRPEMLARRTPDLGRSSRRAELNACPACGGALSPDAAECVACGLAFPEA